EEAQAGLMRFTGVGLVGQAFFTFMLARYGIRGIFLSGRPLRIATFAGFLVLSMLGGFRLSVITCALVFAIQFFMEGLHHTRLLPMFIFAGIFGFILCIPLAEKLPFSLQRALSV